MSTMTCDSVRAILEGEREDDLSSDESSRFTVHLETCAACGQALAMAEADLTSLAGAARRVELVSTPPAPAWGSTDAKLRELVAAHPPGQDDPFPRQRAPGSSTARRRALALPVIDSKREKRPVPLPTVVKAPPPAPAVPLRYRLFGSGRARRGGGLFVLAAAAATVLFGWLLVRATPEPRSPGVVDRLKPLKKQQLLDKDGKPIGWFVDANEPR